MRRAEKARKSLRSFRSVREFSLANCRGGGDQVERRSYETGTGIVPESSGQGCVLVYSPSRVSPV